MVVPSNIYAKISNYIFRGVVYIYIYISFFSFNISHKNIPKYLLYHIKISFVNEKTFEITTSERNYELFGIKFITLNA